MFGLKRKRPARALVADHSEDSGSGIAEGLQRATFAAGCFWGVEAAFREIKGVTSTTVGYTGGLTPNPTYEAVCGHGTGHAEAVEVWFDPSQRTYDELLDTFWAIHNPTTPNRQGMDIGSQYRSAIFVHDGDQAAQAGASLGERQKQIRKRIVTEISPAETFWKAEEYHQRYFEKQGRATCAVTLQHQ
jgi:peptide-methionine (S)-S-oxide reductase